MLHCCLPSCFVHRGVGRPWSGKPTAECQEKEADDCVNGRADERGLMGDMVDVSSPAYSGNGLN